MITAEDYFLRMSRIAGEEPTAEIRANAAILLERVNALLCEPVLMALPAVVDQRVNSGWRTPGYNASIANAAPKSKHMSGRAIDLADPEDALDTYLNLHRDLLEKHELWMENPIATKGWVHLQSVPPGSGNRVFLP